MPSRDRIPLTGTFNVRDAGGWPVAGGRLRRGVLLRGDAPGELDAPSAALLAELGVRTIIDLRTEVERRARPTRAGGADLRVVEIELAQAGELAQALQAHGLPGVYRWAVAQRGGALVEVLAALAQPGGLPALVHCSAGKDRTGLVVAFVQAALGVDDADVAADFATSAAVDDDRFAVDLREQVANLGVDPSGQPELMDGDPEWVLAALGDARTAHDDDDVAAYLRHHGLADAQLRRLREALVEPTAPER
jgi:protein-tyrosine phosphatase